MPTKIKANPKAKPTTGEPSLYLLRPLVPNLFVQLKALCGQIKATNGRLVVPPGCADVLRRCETILADERLRLAKLERMCNCGSGHLYAKDCASCRAGAR